MRNKMPIMKGVRTPTDDNEFTMSRDLENLQEAVAMMRVVLSKKNNKLAAYWHVQRFGETIRLFNEWVIDDAREQAPDSVQFSLIIPLRKPQAWKITVPARYVYYSLKHDVKVDAVDFYEPLLSD